METLHSVELYPFLSNTTTWAGKIVERYTEFILLFHNGRCTISEGEGGVISTRSGYRMVIAI